MSNSIVLKYAARNLLINCAELHNPDTLLIICEDPKLGWYDPQVAHAIETEARSLGIQTTILDVGAPKLGREPHICDAINAHDCTIFLSRIGDQERFASSAPGKKLIMCYARDEQTMVSDYAQVDHLAFYELKTKVDQLLLGARHIEIICPLGTNLNGHVADGDRTSPEDVSLRRFPLGVPQPLSAANFSGQIAVAHYLSSTGSQVYEPASLPLDGVVIADISRGWIKKLGGDQGAAKILSEHHDRVASQFALDGHVVHSFHAGIHPGCTYYRNADEDPDHWSNTIFGNPRILHFHTCGNYAPGEICWMVIDPTIKIDGMPLWKNGRLCPENFAPTLQVLERWPELPQLFAKPSRQIGLQEALSLNQIPSEPASQALKH